MGRARRAVAVTLLLSTRIVGSAEPLSRQDRPAHNVTIDVTASPDGTELFLVASDQAYYFNNNATRLCYTFSIPGS